MKNLTRQKVLRVYENSTLDKRVIHNGFVLAENIPADLEEGIFSGKILGYDPRPLDGTMVEIMGNSIPAYSSQKRVRHFLYRKKIKVKEVEAPEVIVSLGRFTEKEIKSYYDRGIKIFCLDIDGTPVIKCDMGGHIDDA